VENLGPSNDWLYGARAMKIRYIIFLTISAAAAAAFLPDDAKGQNAADGGVNAPSAGVLGILRHGTYQCALPGDAGAEPFRVVPEEGFKIGTASSYTNSEGSGIYLLRGDELVFTRGPKKDQRFKRLGDNTLRKLTADGKATKLICTRRGGAG
jgi:hypothetical protein